MPTMSSFHLLLLILLSVLFVSIHPCHGRLLTDDQIQPPNKMKDQSIESNPLKREWRTSGGAATTAQSLKDFKTRTSTKVEDHTVKAVLVSGAVRIQSHVSVSWHVPRMEKHKGHPGSMDVLATSPHAGYPQTSQSMVLSEEQQEHESLEEQEVTITNNESLSMDYQMPQRGPSIHNK